MITPFTPPTAEERAAIAYMKAIAAAGAPENGLIMSKMRKADHETVDRLFSAIAGASLSEIADRFGPIIDRGEIRSMGHSWRLDEIGQRLFLTEEAFEVPAADALVIFSQYVVSNAITTKREDRVRLVGYKNGQAWLLDPPDQAEKWSIISGMITADYYIIPEGESYDFADTFGRKVMIRLTAIPNQQAKMLAKSIETLCGMAGPDETFLGDLDEGGATSYSEIMENDATERAVLSGESAITINIANPPRFDGRITVDQEMLADLFSPLIDSSGKLRFLDHRRRCELPWRAVEVLSAKAFDGGKLFDGLVVIVIVVYFIHETDDEYVYEWIGEAGRFFYMCRTDGVSYAPLTPAERAEIIELTASPQDIESGLATVRELQELL